MAIAFRASATATTQTSGSLTFTDPGTTGDYEIMFVEADVSGAGAWSTPTGWTALFANEQLVTVDGATIGIFYRASAAGGGASISITIPNGAGTHACGIIGAWSGADSAFAPVTAGQQADSAHTDPWGVTCPTATANAAGGYWIAMAAIDPNTPTGTDIWTGPVGASFVGRIDGSDVSGWNAMSMAYGAIVAGSAASGTCTLTDTRGGSASAAFAGYTSLLTPAAGAAAPTIAPPRRPPEPPPEEPPPGRRRALVPPAGPGPAVYARRRPLPIEPEEQLPQPRRALQAFPLVQGPAVYARRNAPPEASGEATDVVRKPLAFVPPAPAAVQTYARPRAPALEEPPPDPPRRVLYPFSLVQGAAVYARPRGLLEQQTDLDLELRRARPAFVPASVVVQTIFRRPPPVPELEPEAAIRRALYPFSLVQGAAVYARVPRPQPENDPDPYFPPRRALVPPAPAVVPVFAKLRQFAPSAPEDDFVAVARRLPFSLAQGAAVYARRRPPPAEDAAPELPAARRPLAAPAAAVVPPFARLRRRLEVDDEPLIAPPPRRTIVPPAPAVVPVRFRRLNIVREDEDAVIARPRAPRLYIPFVPTTARPPFVARFIDSNYPTTATDQGPAASLVEIGSYPMEVTSS